MTDDEKAIRQVVSTWIAATKSGDLPTVLSLMSDDVLFMVPGQEPFGKEAFAAASKNMSSLKLEGTAEIMELKVLGEWAFIRNHIELAITSQNGNLIERKGYTLTLLHKEADGQWRLVRDANLVTTCT